MSKYISDAREQAKLLELQGFDVYLDPIYLERLETAVDDWDFADLPNHTLIRLTKDGKSVEVDSQGEREVALVEVVDRDNFNYAQSWTNELLPPAIRLLLDHFGDGKDFEFADGVYAICVHSNGWFEDFYFVDGQQHGDTSDAYYDVPMPFDAHASFIDRFPEAA